jgi:anhydro-N-acetylmuramic acid kinase
VRTPSKTLRGELFVGLMSGTSADGIDAVVAALRGQGRGLRATLRAHVHTPFAARLRQRVLHACLHGTVAEICELNFALGECFADAALAAIHKAGLKPAQITAIGSHGQTVHHLPNARLPSTLQIGEPCVIAERTGITTVADFRVRDMAAGGQGAPLVPYTDWALFTDKTCPRIVQNIGGIGNLTFLPPGAGVSDVLAFDTGPGNMIMDAVMTTLTKGRRAYDREGRLAARGKVSEALLAECMKHPYVRRRPPKTTGREEFGEMFVRWFLSLARKLRLDDADIVATATAFTAESIVEAYRRFVFPNLAPALLAKLRIILGGGGAKNLTLVRMLRQRLAHDLRVHRVAAVDASADGPQRRDGRGGETARNSIEILTHADFGIPDSAKEALAFAILAHATLHGRPSNVIGSTGARRSVVLGKISPAYPCRSHSASGLRR